MNKTIKVDNFIKMLKFDNDCHKVIMSIIENKFDYVITVPEPHKELVKIGIQKMLSLYQIEYESYNYIICIKGFGCIDIETGVTTSDTFSGMVYKNGRIDDFVVYVSDALLDNKELFDKMIKRNKR